MTDHHHQGLPFGAQLPADGGDRCHAGGVEQAESQEAGGGGGGEQQMQGVSQLVGADPQNDTEGADHRFLGGEAGDQGGDHPPVSEAQGGKQGSYQTAQGCQNAGCAVRHHVEFQVKGLEEPDDDSGHENDGERPGEEVLRLFPHQQEHALGGGQPVVGKLHDKGDGIAPEQRTFQHQGREDPDHHAAEV